jgi:NitT/TauT family transport system substrate-binding protein
VVFASKRFADANPALMKVFLAAKDEADKLIAADKSAAAESYARMSRVNLKPELIRAMLDDKETSFTVAPAGVMKYADFLGRIGTIKNPPRAWTELFIPELQSYSGS